MGNAEHLKLAGRRRFHSLAIAAVLAGLLAGVLSPPAFADFGVSDFDVTYTDAIGDPATLAGSHPFAQTTTIRFNSISTPDGPVPDGQLRDQDIVQIPGFVGNVTAVPACANADFLTGDDGICSADTIVGIVGLDQDGSGNFSDSKLFNLVPPNGAAAQFGFRFVNASVRITLRVSPNPPYNILAIARSTPEVLPLYGVEVTIWGVPADPAHDSERGAPAGVSEQAFLTLPRACQGPLETTFEATSWEGGFDSGGVLTHDALGDPLGFSDCASLAFDPDVTAVPTTPNASAPAGFDFSIDVDDPGLTDPDGRAKSDLKKAVVTLPEGMTVNPSSADGLGACSPAQLDAETASSDFGAGCPASSKVASVDVETPLLDETLEGAVFIATPYENPFGSLLAGYLVIKSKERGIVVKLPGRIDLDPNTGRLVASFDNNPQLPFSHLEVRFKIGNRAPLVTPPTCGIYEVRTELFPWSGNPSVIDTDTFTIDHGPDGGACTTGDPGQPGNSADAARLPFSPSFDAGTVSPIAGAFSPLVVKASRPDGFQALSGLNLDFPQGLIGKLAGVASCPQEALDAAAANSGRAELAAPSCPAAGRIGVVDVGAGAGPTPFHVQGTAYLAGPYRGAPISIAVITPAVAGPFDLGTVVVRAAANVDSKTAQIHVASDPLPQILQGIPLHVRSVAVNADRPDFTLNPTSCDPMSLDGTIFGSPALAEVSSRFQLGECGRLGFKPRMTLRLRGGTKRGKHPALTIALLPRPGDANIAAISVALPRSEFLENAHIRTVCTRPDFAADACPKGAVYGRASVVTTLLDYPLRGNVYLRSSDNLLPDVVPDLRGPSYQPIKLETAGRTDSIRGGIRTTIDFVPDAPFTKALVQLRGGNKGLLVNSRNICARTYRATVRYTAHNGDTFTDRPPLKAKCGKRGKKRR